MFDKDAPGWLARPMRRFLSALFLASALSATPALSQDSTCASGYLARAMALIETHFRSGPPFRLFTTQLLLREGRMAPRISTDGKWGPQTASAICSALGLYTGIGFPTILSQEDVVKFTDWIGAAAYANTNGGEFPD